MITLRRIVWPTDFSDLSLKAAQYASQLHQVFGGELHILHVCLQPIVAPAVLDRTTGSLMVGEIGFHPHQVHAAIPGGESVSPPGGVELGSAGCCTCGAARLTQHRSGRFKPAVEAAR